MIPWNQGAAGGNGAPCGDCGGLVMIRIRSHTGNRILPSFFLASALCRKRETFFDRTNRGKLDHVYFQTGAGCFLVK